MSIRSLSLNKVLLTSSIIGLSPFLISLVFAQLSLRIDQPKVYATIPEGEQSSGIIRVSNSSDVDIAVKIHLEDWFYTEKGDGSKVFRPAGTTPYSCSNWISFYPANFILPANSKVPVNYTIRAPRDAKGGYYSVMFFEAAVGKTALKGGGMANVIGSVGSLFYTQIKDTVIKKISVSELGLTQDLPADKLHIKLKVENQGNVASIIKGHYNLLGDNGKVVARGRFGLAYTFPGVKVEIGTVWSKALAPGRYDLLLTLDMEGKPVTEDYEVTVSGDRVTCKVEKAGR